MPRAMKLSLLLVVLALSFGVQSAVGQGGGGGGAARDVVRNEMDRTREMLDRAVDLVRASDCPLAAVPLDEAVRQQENAENAFRSSQLAQAHLFTQKARDLIKTALANCRSTEQGEAVAQRSLEKAQELLDRAGNTLHDTGNPNLQAIYESARDNLTRAWEFYRQKQFKPAVKIGEQVEKMAWKILGAGERQEQRAETYDRRRENVARVVDQARSAVADCGSETARDLLTKAEDLLAQADQLRQSGQVGAALTALFQVRTLATRSVNECESSEGLELRYRRLQSRLESLRDRAAALDEAARTQLTRLLDQAAQQLTLAQEHLNAGSTDQALAALQGAQLMLRQAEGVLP